MRGVLDALHVVTFIIPRVASRLPGGNGEYMRILRSFTGSNGPINEDRDGEKGEV